jgi:glycolate oxidase FAD binding subunit
LLHPTSIDELAALLAEANAAGHRVAAGGAFSKPVMGGPASPADRTISLAAMNRVLEYEPNDLTVSVEAGLKWSEFQQQLAAHRQMVPLDPPWYEDATVGGVLASNGCGPRRRLYGSARDVVIGLRFATMTGEAIQSGGMVVKNVAGLDLGKLMIGSFGTLGVIAVANFKLAPVPPVSATFLQRASTPEEIIKLRDAVLTGLLQPAAIDILKEPAGGRWTLALQVGATERVMERYRRELGGAEMLSGENEKSFWRAAREFTPDWMKAHAGGAVVRVSSELSEVGPVLASLPGPALSRAGNGVTYGAFEDAAAASAWAQSSPHRAVIEASPPGSTVERWPNPGNDFGVMEQIKQMLDPKRLLNAGRLYGRL